MDLQSVAKLMMISGPVYSNRKKFLRTREEVNFINVQAVVWSACVGWNNYNLIGLEDHWPYSHDWEDLEDLRGGTSGNKHREQGIQQIFSCITIHPFSRRKERAAKRARKPLEIKTDPQSGSRHNYHHHHHHDHHHHHHSKSCYQPKSTRT